MNSFQIKDFTAKYNVHQTFIKSFSSLLDQNNVEDLDITDKNISIDVENLEFELLGNDAVAFQSDINQDGRTIGYYKLVFDLKGKLIDEFFVI